MKEDIKDITKDVRGLYHAPRTRRKAVETESSFADSIVEMKSVTVQNWNYDANDEGSSTDIEGWSSQ